MILKRILGLLLLGGLVSLWTPSLYGQSVLHFPRVISSSSVFTGLAVGNPTAAEVSVTFTAYQPDGTTYTGTGVQNPVTVKIPAGGQLAKLFPEVFGPGDFNGWVDGASRTPGLSGFFLNGNGALTDLDGAGAINAAADFVLPFAAENTITQTELTLVNVNADPATATITLYGTDGSTVTSKDVSLPARGLVRQTLTGIFGAMDFSAASHVKVHSGRPLVGHEVVANYAIAGTSVTRETAAFSGQPVTPSTTYILPQFATGGGWLSLMGIVNAGGVGQEVTLTAYNDDGTLSNVPTNPKRISLDANAALRTTVGELFSFPADTLTTGWIEVQSSLGFLSSYIAYGNTTSPSFAAVAGTDIGSASRFEVFSQVAEGAGFFTGLTVVNPGTQDANIEFYTLRPDGTTVGKSTFTVKANQRVGKLFRELLPSSLLQVGGWAFLRSSQPVVGAVLFGTTNGDALANVPQQLPAGDFMPPAQTTGAINGRVSSVGTAIPGVQMTLSGPVTATTATDNLGQYTFPQLPSGAYTVVAVSPAGAAFAPAQKSVTLSNQNMDGVNFEGGSILPAGVPSIQFVSPTSTFAGNSALNIQILGNGFTPTSVAKLNGQPVITVYVGATELQAVIPQSQLTQPGTLQLTVETPPPGGGPSATLSFVINPLPVNPLIEGLANVGDFPAGVAIDTVRNQALVTNESDNTVTVLDLAALTIVKTITVGRSPAEGIALYQAGKIALVANPGDNNVSVIDLDTLQVKGTAIQVGQHPIGIAVNTISHKALVTNSGDGNVSVINLDTLQVEGNAIKVGTNPHGVAIQPRYNQAVVANSGSNTVTLLDLNSNTIMATIPVGSFPRGVAINVGTNVAVVANANSNNVSVIDLNRQSVAFTTAVDKGPTAVAIHEPTNLALITNSGLVNGSQDISVLTTVSVLDLSYQAVVSTIPVGNAAFGIDVDQNNQRAVVANFGSKNVFVLRVPNPRPSVNSVSPSTFPAGGGTFTITVNGVGFVPTSVVTLNGQTLPTTFISSTQLQAVISADLVQQLLQVHLQQAQRRLADGTTPSTFAQTADLQFNISVTNPGPGGGNAPPPADPQAGRITPQNSVPVLVSISISPTQVTAGTGPVTLTLNGNNFNGTSVINVGNQKASPATSAGGTVMTVTIPANLLTTPGTYPVSVTNPPPGGGTSATASFQVDAQSNPSPNVTSVSPSAIPAGAGAVQVTVQGSGFIGLTTATLGSAQGTVAGNTIRFSLPASDTLNPGTLRGLVSTPTPGGGSASFSVNILNVTPTIAGFTPAAANAGSAAVDIVVTGTNFGSGTQVTVEGTPVPTQFVSATQLKGTLTDAFLRRSGQVHIGVTNPPPGGGSATGGAFTITSPKPTLTSINPAALPLLSPATLVTLTGGNFVGNSAVTVGGTPVSAVFNSASSITATIPAALLQKAAALGVQVTNPAPGGGPSEIVTLSVQNPVPVITAVTPSQIPGDQTNAVLNVTGNNFVTTSVVQVGSIALTTTFVSATQLTAALPPPLPLGKLTVTVTNPGPGGGPSNGFPIEIAALAPTITSVNPPAVAPGQTIQVTGTNFGPGSSILMRGQPIATSASSTTSLTGTIPAASAAGSADIVVRNPATSNSPAQDSAAFTIQITNPAPVIVSLDPSSALRGATVTIHGSGFMASSQVQVNGNAVSSSFVDGATLTFVLPADTAVGAATVQVSNAGPGGGAASASLTVQAPTPVVAGVSPSSGQVSTTVPLTVTGSNFVTGASIVFNGNAVGTSFVGVATLTASVTLPGTAGVVPVGVTNPGGVSSNTVPFTITAPPPKPVVAGVSPASAQAGTGVLLTVTGSNFVTGASIVFNGSAVGTSFVSAGALTAFVTLPGTAGVVPVGVTNPGGVSSNTVTFTITAPPPNNPVPVITSVTPSSVTAGASGTSLTIAGSNFISSTTVLFGTNPVGITSQTSTALTVSVPAAYLTTPATVSVTVTNPAPGGGSAAAVFTINAQAATATKLGFITPPTSTTAGLTIAPAVLVAVQDASGNTIANATTSVTLSIGANPGGGKLSGAVTANASNGVAMFPGLSIDKAGSGYALRAVPAPALLTFDELPFQPVNNLNYGGVTFGFTVAGAASTDAYYDSFGPGTTAFVQDPGLEGNTSGVLTFDFAMPTTNLSFGVAFSTSASTSGLTVQLFDNNLVSLGVTTVNISPKNGFSFSDGNYIYSGAPVRRAILVFNRNAAPRFDLDNLMFDSANSAGILGATSSPFDIAFAVPVLSGISPASGLPGTSLTATLTGSGFVSGGTTVSAGAGITVTSVAVSGGTVLTANFAIAGNATPGTRGVTVSTAGGTSAPVTFTVSTSGTPAITSISPSGGVAGNAVSVTLSGVNFIGGATTVSAGTDITVSNVSVGSSTSLTATFTIASAATAGPRNVTVSTSGGTSGPATFTVTALPTLSAISPASGVPGASFTATLTGSGFVTGGTTVSAGTGITVTNVSVSSAITLTATFNIAGTATAGTRGVTVATAGGTSSPLTFTIFIPRLSSISPIGATQGQGNVAITLTGVNLAGTTAIQFFINGSNDSGITVSGVNASTDGTQVTATANVTSSAALNNHQIALTISGQTVNLGQNFLVYASGSPALYTISAVQGAIGSTVTGLTISGASLGNVTSLSFFPQGSGVSDSGITVSSFAATANTITANLGIGSTALIGPHFIQLNTPTSSVFTSAVFNVSTSGGTTVTGLNLFLIHRGDTGTAFSVFGSNLGSVSGITFYNPNGTPETGITASGFVATASSVSANLTLDPNMPVGPRFVLLNAGAVQIGTTLSMTVETQAAQGNVYVSSFFPSSAAAGSSFTMVLSGSNPSGISGFKFQVNGVDDTTLHVTGFATSGFQSTATFSIDSTAAPGLRNLVLLASGGGTVATNLFFNVLQGSPSISVVSPIGASQGQGTISITLTGVNLAGTTAIQFFQNGSNDPGITAAVTSVSSDGTQVTGTANISGSASLSFHSITITRSGQTFNVGGSLFVYASGTPALYTMSPSQGSMGSTITGFTITGAALGNVTSLSFFPQGSGPSDSGITVSNFTAVANSITANLGIGGSALVGPHTVQLNTSTGSFFTSGVFNVSTSAGTTVTSIIPLFIHRGDTGTAFNAFGSNLGSVTGLTFYNPNGTQENGITAIVSAVTSVVSASLTLDPSMAVGPRFVVLNAGGVQIGTTLSMIVESQAAQGNVYASSFFPVSGGNGSSFTMVLSGNNPSGITGFKFQVNGVDDTTLHVTGFSTSGFQSSALLSIDSTAALGTRNLVLLTSGGTITTNLTFNVLQGSPSLSAMSPIGASQGQSNVTITLTGSNLAGTTAVQLFQNGSNDPGIAVTVQSISSDGTQVTGTANISGSALLGFHSITITRSGQTFNVGGNFIVYASGTPALYTMSPSQGSMGSTVTGFTITGASLGSITSLSFSPQNGGIDSGITMSNLSASANSITADLGIGSNAQIGPHNISMNSSNTPFNTNAVFNVSTSGGTTVNSLYPPVIHRGDTGTAFNVFGSNLGSVTGIQFYNPDGTQETLITSSGFSATASSVSANLTLDPNMPVGARTVVLTGSPQLVTTLFITVESQSAQGSVYVRSFAPPSGAAGGSFPVILNGSNPSGITGFKFQVNSVDDTTLHVTGFQTNFFQSSAQLSIDSTAPLGPRNLVLLPSGGGTLATNITFTVLQGLPSISAISPNSGVQGTSVPVTLMGSNFVFGATSIAISGTGVTGNSVTVVSGTSLTATLVIDAAALNAARNITVTTAGGTSNAVTFTVNSSAPTLTSISPSSGTQGTSVAVTLTGTNFVSGATTIAMSGTGVTSTSVNVVSATSLTATLMIDAAAAAGARNLAVFTPNGNSGVGPVQFTVLLPANPLVSLSTSSLAFAIQPVGTTSAPQAVTLTNIGGLGLTITSITLTGTNVSDFSQTNTCGSAVVSGANCQINLTFAPSAMGTRTTTLVIADNASGSPHTVAVSGAASLNLSDVPFTIPDRGALSVVSAGSGSLTVGYATIQPDSGKTTPAGVEILAIRSGGILISEMAIPASAPITTGRLYAEVGGAVITGIAIANTNGQPATISYNFTDASGTDFGSGSTVLPANGQFASFFNQAPFNGGAAIQGTFSFTSSVPVAAVGLRALTNERGEFLLTSLPVVDTSASIANSAVTLAHFADGAGWTSQVVLVNPASSTITGSIQFLDSGGTPVTLTANAQTSNTFSFSLPGRSSFILKTAGAGASVAAGSVRIVPTGGTNSPAAFNVLSWRPAGITIIHTALWSVATTAARLYTESSGSILSGVAIANSSASSATITAALTDIGGNALGTTTLAIPANGQTAKFTSDLFPSLSTVQGVLRITSSNSGMAVTGLRSRTNERGDFLIAGMPAVDETAAASSATTVFPHFANGGGYTPQFVLYSGTAGQATTGHLRLFNQSGSAVSLDLTSSAKDAAPPAVSLTAPAAGATVGGTVTISAIASDDVGVASVQFQLDGTNLGYPVTSAPYSLLWFTTLGAPGTHTVRAIASDFVGNRTTSSGVTVTVNNGAAPTLSSITPNIGSAGGTVAVTILGTNFVSGGTAIAVSGSGVTGTAVSVTGATSLTASIVVASSATPGTYNVSVSTPGGVSGTLPFTVGAAPAITSVSPNSAYPGETPSITITGTNFTPGATSIVVSGTGVSGVDVFVSGTTSLTAFLLTDPAATPGVRALTVVVSGSSSGTLPFTLAVPPAPTLSTINLASGIQGNSMIVTLTGTNFVANEMTVSAGAGITAGNVTVSSSTQMAVDLVIDLTAATGPRNLAVSNIGGASPTGLTFTVNAPAGPPALTSISPSSGIQGAILPVTFIGTNFVGGGQGGTAIVFSGTGVTVGIVAVNAGGTSMTVDLILTGAPGDRTVSVTTAAGVTATQTFTILPNSLSLATGFNVTTAAGLAQVSGAVDGQGSSALFHNPQGITGDPSNLYIADESNNTLRKMNLATRTVVTLAGTAGVGRSTVNGTGTAARLNHPTFVWTDGFTLFFTEPSSSTVRDIFALSNSFVSTSSGFPGVSATIDGATGLAKWNSPLGVWNYRGILYVADGTTIRQIYFAGGAVTTLAGAAQTPGYVDDAGTAARFGIAAGLWGDGTNLYIADYGNAAVRKMNLATNSVSTIAGPAQGFHAPAAIWGDGTNLYVTDIGDNTVRQINIATGVVSVIAGSSGIAGSTDAVGSSALFNGPLGIWGDGTNIYVVDSNNQTIRVLTPIIPVPALTSIVPSSGVQGTSVPVTLTGTSFVSGATTLAISGTGVTSSSVNVTNGTSLTATLVIAADAALGSRSITVSTAAGTSGSVPFTVNPLLPTLAGMTPSSGLQGTTFSATLFGTNFVSGATTIAVSGTGVTGNSVNVLGTTSLTATFTIDAAAAAGLRAVTVNTTGGTSGSINFIVNGVPTLSAISPPSGLQGATVPIALTGTNFGVGAMSISASGTGILITSVNVTSATSATATFQLSGAPGSYNINVTTAGGSSNTLSFTINSSTVTSAAQFAVTHFAGSIGGQGSADGTGSAARFNPAVSAWGDGTNLYVADNGSHTIRKIVIATGVVTTVSGSAGTAGSADGTGSSALFHFPYGIWGDGTNLYVADKGNNTIRKIVLATGSVTTLAGSAGSAGSVDGSAALFNAPTGIWGDGAGNLYVTDAGNNTIRRVSASGLSVSTVAGSAGASGIADGTGSAALFNRPRGIWGDGTNLYVADFSNDTIRQIALSGFAVTTLAGFPASSAETDGTGGSARFAGPAGIWGDGAGNLYVTDSNGGRIRQVTTAGVVTTLVGSAGIGAVDGNAATAKLFGPIGIWGDGAGNLYVADAANNTIRQVVVSPVTVSTLAGAAFDISLTDGTGSAARFLGATGVWGDNTNMYVADQYGSAIRKAAIATAAVSTLTTGVTPSGIWSDGTNVYIASNQFIKKVVIATSAVTTLAGSGSFGSLDGAAASAQFNNPQGLWGDGTNLYVADSGNGTIRKVLIANGFVTTLAGSAGVFGSADGTGSAAQFTAPFGIWGDGTNLYVVDAGLNSIRKVAIATGLVTTLSNSSVFNGPLGIWGDGTNLYVADTGNFRVRKFEIGTGTVTTLAGIGRGETEDGLGTTAGFFLPWAVWGDGSNLYVADYSSIRKLAPASLVAPVLTSISPASGAQGTAYAVTLLGQNFVPGATSVFG